MLIVPVAVSFRHRHTEMWTHPGLGKALVVVVNGALMDNHQEELADALAQRNYLKATTPERLAQTLAELNDSPMARVPYPSANPDAFAAVVDDEMGAAQEGGT